MALNVSQKQLVRIVALMSLKFTKPFVKMFSEE